ncbi:flagellar biosynthetic protein FliR [Corallococcus sp. M34]|uniref:EscT/YscT/HrcT family type III secretion system export apparatus protein n=1 Tax=Citreicoccus inhibens TaxID=2849499 RepID=UPI001C23F61C|nr:flagellar biosynthetic protein FliR [Citreicoccus inhibens]MBU8899265.1 flagellar biosynthetic protein FliR [Citreicoccus inhibens]
MWDESLTELAPHLVAVALCASRLIPISFLCPLLGGQAAPTSVKLALVLALSLFLHVEAGVRLPQVVETPFELGALVVREFVMGSVMGLVAALPFDSARMAGRMVDLVRGTSAEASLPVAGSREAASGEGLYNLLLALVVSGSAFPLVLSGLIRGFGVVRLGAFVPTEVVAVRVATWVGAAMTTGLAVGAPVAAAVLAVDCFLGMASRVAAQVDLKELGAPLRILGGGAVLWLGVGVMCERLLSGVMASGAALAWLGEKAQ